MQVVGHSSDPNEVSDLRRPWVYPNVMVDPLAPTSPSSGRLLAAEEGLADAASGDGKTAQDQSLGETSEEPYQGQVLHPQYRRQYKAQINKDYQLQDKPIQPPSEGMYGVDAHFGYEGIPYHPGFNTGWYDPSGRDARYGSYPQYILPPPFAPRRYTGYGNDPAMHLQVGAMGRGPYINSLPPFHGPHPIEYGRELPSGGYRHNPFNNSTSSNAEAGPSIREGGNRSPEATTTHPGVSSHPPDPATTDSAMLE